MLSVRLAWMSRPARGDTVVARSTRKLSTRTPAVIVVRGAMGPDTWAWPDRIQDQASCVRATPGTVSRGVVEYGVLTPCGWSIAKWRCRSFHAPPPWSDHRRLACHDRSYLIVVSPVLERSVMTTSLFPTSPSRTSTSKPCAASDTESTPTAAPPNRRCQATPATVRQAAWSTLTKSGSSRASSSALKRTVSRPPRPKAHTRSRGPRSYTTFTVNALIAGMDWCHGVQEVR
jgi:hypothetical protein